jgi:hypothetical protein
MNYLVWPQTVILLIIASQVAPSPFVILVWPVDPSVAVLVSETIKTARLHYRHGPILF